MRTFAHRDRGTMENGRIVEDWSVTDTLGMLRQLGAWRSVLVALQQWRALAAVSRH